MQNFSSYRLIGTQAEELIKLLLSQSGYLVYDYAYERLLPSICEKYHTNGIKSTSTFLRIRHSPDLLVYDDLSHELLLVEVKMRTVLPDMKFSIDEFNMRNYQEFWKDAILVIVANKGDFFYGQKIDDLKNSNGFYDLASDFLKIEDIFYRITKKNISEYKEKASQILFTNLQNNNTLKTKSYSISEIRNEYPRAYEKWTDEEDNCLIEEYRIGLSRSKIASLHERKKGAITSRLKKLGEIPY